MWESCPGRGAMSCPSSEHINNKYVNSLSQEILYWCCFLLSTNSLWIFMLIRVNTLLYVELKFNDPLPMVRWPLTDLAFQHYSRFAETRQTEKSGCWLPLLCYWHWYMSLFSHKFAVILMLTPVGLLFLVFFPPILGQGPCFARFLCAEDLFYFKVQRK